MKSEKVLIDDVDIIKKYFEQSQNIIVDDYYEFEFDEVFDTDLKYFMISSIPNDVRIMIIDDISSFHIGNNGELEVSRCWSINVDGWLRDYSANFYCKKIVDYVKKNEFKYKIKFDNLEADGVMHDIWYHYIDFEDKTIEQIINYCKEIEEEISGLIQLQINERGIGAEYLEDEEKFSKGILMPLFRSMGFNDVFYNHGKREFGKDVIFTVFNKLGIRNVFGVQVKIGNLSGEANSEIDKIISQIDDVFSIPYINKYNKEKTFITDLLIIISGRYTNNAIEKILYKVKNTNVHFYDIDKVNELISKYIK